MDNNTFNLKFPSLTRGILVMILGVLVFTMGLGVLGVMLGLAAIGYGVFEAVMFSQKNKNASAGRPAWKKAEETQPEANEGCGLKRYHLVDNIMGWVVGIVACAVYILTAEATASWWDCGEYIATANKLQVGHPPGAPTFQLLGRLFSMFSDPEDVAHAVNIMSAVCSGLTIMFLFWGITMLGKHLLPDPKNVSLKDARTWGVFAAGLVGAFAYCFSDSFWFSAVEGEVYAMSSFFTALVFWAILKWEEQSDDPHSMRWIVLISLLVGVAIGVHLLNLLTVPAIFYVVYFKKWKKVTWKGFLITGVLSFVTLALILWAIIPGIVNLDSAFDVFFVNSLGLPFNSGTIFYFALLAGLVVWGLWFSQKKKKPMLNAAIMSFAMLVIGYSTFFILVIRANTNTPLNENCPKDAVSMRAYLGREQYGETPFLTGNYFTERPKYDETGYVVIERGYTKYVRGKDADGNDRYIPADYDKKYVYEESHFLPRMWSTQRSVHPLYYRLWTDPDKVNSPDNPTLGDNITYMNRYQFGWMYWRYFMWNFAGRQNDQQGHYFNTDGSRDYLKGNWICGINFIDEARLGPQSDMPDFMKNDKSRNVYYLLPLLLGLIGLVYHIIRHPNDAFIVLMMFLMTGMAIAFYLNMPPCQPRERDYAFVGSFSFFAIWIGLGVMGLAEWISGKKEKLYKVVMPVVFVLALLAAPVLMACQNWDDHDRSEKTAARDFAENYMNSLKPNSILITFGDNDTFPLWYIQEVEGVRTDVRILNFTLSGMHWYVEQLYNKLYESEPLPFTLPKEFYGLGKDQAYMEPSNTYYEVEDLMKQMRDNPKAYLRETARGDTLLVIPTNKFKITLDIPALVKKGVVTPQVAAQMESEIRWEIKSPGLTRPQLMLLDILGKNRFMRDISVGTYPKYTELADVFPNIDNYCISDGLNYKLVPYKMNRDITCDDCGTVFRQRYSCPRCGKPSGWMMRSETSADYLLGSASGKPLKWGNLDKDIYVDPVSREQFAPKLYQTLLQLAMEESEVGNYEKAQKLLEIYEKNFPEKNFPIEVNNDAFASLVLSGYFKAFVDSKPERIKEMWNRYYKRCDEMVKYYASFDETKAEGVSGVLNETWKTASRLYIWLLATADDEMRVLDNPLADNATKERAYRRATFCLDFLEEAPQSDYFRMSDYTQDVLAIYTKCFGESHPERVEKIAKRLKTKKA